MAVGHEDEPKEREEIEENVQEPHHGEVDERVEQPRAGILHMAPAKARELGVGIELAERTNQVRGMKVAAWLTSRDEELHGVTRFLAGRVHI